MHMYIYIYIYAEERKNAGGPMAPGMSLGLRMTVVRRTVGERFKWATLEGVKTEISRNCCSTQTKQFCCRLFSSGMFLEVVVLT